MRKRQEPFRTENMLCELGGSQAVDFRRQGKIGTVRRKDRAVRAVARNNLLDTDLTRYTFRIICAIVAKC